MGEVTAGFADEVLRQFERVREDIKDLSEKVDTLKDGDISTMKVDIAMLQVKAGFWGAIGGAVMAIPLAIAIVEIMKK